MTSSQADRVTAVRIRFQPRQPRQESDRRRTLPDSSHGHSRQRWVGARPVRETCPSGPPQVPISRPGSPAHPPVGVTRGPSQPQAPTTPLGYHPKYNLTSTERQPNLLIFYRFWLFPSPCVPAPIHWGVGSMLAHCLWYIGPRLQNSLLTRSGSMVGDVIGTRGDGFASAWVSIGFFRVLRARHSPSGSRIGIAVTMHAPARHDPHAPNPKCRAEGASS